MSQNEEKRKHSNWVVLFERNAEGHHLEYLRAHAAALTRQGLAVVVLSPNSLVLTHAAGLGLSASMATTFGREAPSLDPNIVTQTYSIAMRWRALSQDVDILARQRGQSPMFVFFTFLDDFLGSFLPSVLIDYNFRYRCAGLLLRPRSNWMRPKYSYLRQGWLSPESGLRAKSLFAICTLDEMKSASLSARTGKPVVLFPDVADLDSTPSGTDLSRRLISAARGLVVISLLGTISTRKGLIEFLEAIKSRPQGIFFFIGGSPSWSSMSDYERVELRRLMEDSGNNAMVCIKSIPDGAEFNSLVQASSAVYVASRNFPFSSNILVKASHFGVPVISDGSYLIGSRVKDHGLGVVLPETSLSTYCKGQAQRDIGALKVDPGFASRGRAFAAQHSETLLNEAFEKIVALATK